MKNIRLIFIILLAGLALAFAGCGGGGSGGGGDAPPAVTDNDSDGVPNVDDSFPDDATRFAAFLTQDLVTPNEVFSVALDINDAVNPLIVGAAEQAANPGVLRAVHWILDSASGNPASAIGLNAVNGVYGNAYAVNDEGTIVGEAQDGSNFVPVTWTTSGPAPSALPLVIGEIVFEQGAAYGVNNLKQIVGEFKRVDGSNMAVLWNFDAVAEIYTAVELPSLGGDNATAIAISDGGWVVGESQTAGGLFRATLWMLDLDGLPGAPIDLGTLVGHLRSIALGVDNEGRIVGESEDSAGQVSAVLWTPAPGDGLLADGLYNNASRGLHASAQAINDGNRFVGHAGQGTAARAVVWDIRTTQAANFDHVVTGGAPNFEPVNLFSQAYGMNQAGMIVGIAVDKGFLALPIP